MIKGLLTMMNGEKIPFELYDEEKPITVNNFVKLIKEGYYDGKIFHRVIPGFVSQGGCPYGTGTGDLGYVIPCECDPRKYNNVHKHVPGALSMAHRGPNTGCCQFFIVHEPQPHLDGRHTVFGMVTDNLEAVLNMHNGDRIKSMVVED